MKFQRLALPLTLLFAAGAHAATDGTLGATSNGSTDVSITINELVQVSGLDDINLAAYDGNGVDRTGNTDFCVYTNNASVTQYVDVTVSSVGGFALTSGANTIPFTVSLAGNGVTGGTQFASTAITSGDTNNLQDPNRTSTSCADTGESHQLSVSVLAADLDQAPATGSPYVDTITILVAPD